VSPHSPRGARRYGSEGILAEGCTGRREALRRQAKTLIAIPLIVAVLAVGEVPHAELDDPCAKTRSELGHALKFAEFAKEPQDKVRQVFDGATAAQVRCPMDEELAYLRLRSAELGRGAFLGQKPSPAAAADWRRLARETAARFPRSARILTVDARGANSVDVAERAVALDEHYVPAKVALANALVAAGEASKATKILDGVTGLENVSDGYTALARARFRER